jgi:hypothetical protein
MRHLTATTLGLAFCETSADMFLPLDSTFSDWNQDQPNVQDQRVAHGPAGGEVEDDRRQRARRPRRFSWAWRTA